MDYRQLSEELCDMHFRYARELKELLTLINTRGEDAVLIWASRQEGPVYAMDIISCFDLSAGRVANILKQMEKRGYITRTPDADDLRRSHILLTEEGKQAAGVKYEQMVSGHQKLLKIFGESDANDYARIMRGFVSKLSKEK